MLNIELIAALVASPTFYGTVVLWGLACLAGAGALVAAVWRLRRQQIRWRALSPDERGSATAADFVLTLPFFLVVVLWVIQFGIMANDALIVHYAAYSAARSARVWMWDRQMVRIPGVDERILNNPVVRRNRDPEVQRRVERAARFALIAASPADPAVRSAGGTVPRRVLRAVAAEGGRPDRRDVLTRKARYAFAPENSTVRFDIVREISPYPDILFDYFKPADAWPVTAEVRYRMHLAIPAAWVLGERGNGHFYRWVDAKVTLL
jgi:hypothetical protein